jgi:hypothetical protein
MPLSTTRRNLIALTLFLGTAASSHANEIGVKILFIVTAFDKKTGVSRQYESAVLVKFEEKFSSNLADQFFISLE